MFYSVPFKGRNDLFSKKKKFQILTESYLKERIGLIMPSGKQTEQHWDKSWSEKTYRRLLLVQGMFSVMLGMVAQVCKLQKGRKITSWRLALATY